MNDKLIESISNESQSQPDNGCARGLPQYELYKREITDSKGSFWTFLSSLCQFLKDRSNSTVIVIAVIIALAYVAAVFIKNGNDNYVKLIGGITLGAMIFTLGLSALLGIRHKSGTNTEKKQRGSVESGPGHGSKRPNGVIERPDKRGESD